MTTRKDQRGRPKTMPIQVPRRTWRQVRRLAREEQVSGGQIVAESIAATVMARRISRATYGAS